MKDKKEMTMYEEDLIWMSYRYCIGRHTIAAGMHAGEIAKHEYDKLSHERRQFMAFDIRREIANSLSWSHFNFRMDPNILEENYKPLELLLEFFEKENIHNRKDIVDISSVYATTESYNNPQNIIYEVSEKKKKNGDTSYVSMMDIIDLLVWADLASCFDVDHYKKCLVKTTEGKEETLEYFDSWIEDRREGCEFAFRKVKRCVKAYLRNPAVCCYIDEDCIIKDNI